MGVVISIYSSSEISRILNIGPEFIFVDSCEEIDPGKTSKMTFTFNNRHTFLWAHFLSEPMVPGVIIIEAMLQSIAITLYSDPRWLGLALVVNVNADFLKPVKFDSCLETEVNISLNNGLYATASASSSIDGDQICKLSANFYSDFFSKQMSDK